MPRLRETSHRPHRHAARLAVLALGVACADIAQAQAQASVDPGRLALMRSTSLDPNTSDLASALDPVLLAQLETVAGLSAAERPALDLPAVQLALDCVGETPQCLRAVTTQTATDSLLAPSVQAAGAETVVTLLYFDARGAGDLRSVVRRHAGEDAADVRRATLDAVPGMLRELFGIAEPPASEPSAEPEPQPAFDDSAIDSHEEPVQKPFPVGPVVVGSVGVVLVGAGLAFGLAANSSEDAWLDAKVGTEPEVDAALEIEDRAKLQATLSNIGFAVGGAALAAGVVWLALELSSDEPGERASVGLLPQLTPSSAGVTVRGSL